MALIQLQNDSQTNGINQRHTFPGFSRGRELFKRRDRRQTECLKHRTMYKEIKQHELRSSEIFLIGNLAKMLSHALFDVKEIV